MPSTSIPPPPADSLLPAASGPLRGLVQEVNRLLEVPLPPDEFFGRYLPWVLQVLRAPAGAVWQRGPQGEFRLAYQVNRAAVGLEQTPSGPACHAELLRVAAEQKQAFWIPSHSGPDTSDGKVAAANLTGHGLVLAPILIDQQVAGFVEVWQESPLDRAAGRRQAELLGELAGVVAAYLHRAQWNQLRGQRQLWEQLQEYSRQVHGSLDPREVAYRVANDGRRLLECDQVSVAVCRGRRVQVEAVSGAPSIARRGPVYRPLRTLFEAVLTWGEKLVYTGAANESLPPDVRQALDGYLAQSPSKLLVVLPLRDGRQREDERPCAALLAECFQPTLGADQFGARLEALTPDVTSALYNAREHGQFPLQPLARLLAGLRDSLRGRVLLQVGLVAVAVLAVLATLVLVQAPLRREARGELLPRERQIVYSDLNGKVVELKAQHGEQVVKGQELLLLEDLELELQIEQLALKVSSAEQRAALLRQQLGKAVGTEERNMLTKELVNQEYEMRKAAAERDILLQGSRNPRKTPIVAPMTGKVVTFDVQEQLVGKTVKPGDPLLRLARVQGPWEVELHIPEAHLGALREGLERSPQGALDVQLLLTSHPHRTYRGRLDRDGLGGETTVKDNAVVLPARVQIVDRDLLTQLEAMPVGVEVRAKIDCGRRPVGYVWFVDLWEFFYEHIWF